MFRSGSFSEIATALAGGTALFANYGKPDLGRVITVFLWKHDRELLQLFTVA